MTQYVRPTSDILTSPWTTTPLYDKTDEGAPGDDVVVISDSSPIPGEPFVCATNNITDPELGTGHILRARWAKNATDGANYILTLEIREGYVDETTQGTLIATLASAAISGDTLQIDTYPLTTGEANSIGDYTDLQLRCFGTKSGGGASRAVKVDFIEMEAPDYTPAPDYPMFAGKRPDLWAGLRM